MTEKATIGLIGLAVMGENLARNFANHKIKTVVYNRTYAKTENFLQRFGKEPFLAGTDSLEDFVAAIAKPRKIILMVKAGAPVDQMLKQLLPLLEKDDLIMDCGNSYYEDTIRRSKLLSNHGLRFMGIGVSGGEYGALHGPSMMPGGDISAYEEIEPLLTKVAAQAEGEACVTYIGTDGAGHYVKMVHNGIEYADMQLIAEVYSIMKVVLRLSDAEMEKIWRGWNQGQLKSYLVEITADILGKVDVHTQQPLLEEILDVAGQKGTGKWTSQSALDLGVPVTTITAAVFARYMSARKAERREACRVLMTGEGLTEKGISQEKVLEDLAQALYAAKICAYAQGFSLLAEAAKHYNWQLDFAAIAKIWRNGCIIRADFLNTISASFAKKSTLKNLMLDDYFAKILNASRPAWCRVVALAKEYELAVPALSTALDYLDGYKTDYCNANLLQAQRDYFGAHTYERLDKTGIFHTEWQEK